MVGVIFYAIFADGEKQPWADPLEEEDAKPNTTSGSLEVELNKERDINEQPQATEMSLR